MSRKLRLVMLAIFAIFIIVSLDYSPTSAQVSIDCLHRDGWSDNLFFCVTGLEPNFAEDLGNNYTLALVLEHLYPASGSGLEGKSRDIWDCGYEEAQRLTTDTSFEIIWSLALGCYRSAGAVANITSTENGACAKATATFNPSQSTFWLDLSNLSVAEYTSTLVLVNYADGGISYQDRYKPSRQSSYYFSGGTAGLSYFSYEILVTLDGSSCIYQWEF